GAARLPTSAARRRAHRQPGPADQPSGDRRTTAAGRHRRDSRDRHPRPGGGRRLRPPPDAQGRAMTRFWVALLREAIASARGQPVASLLTVAMVAGMCTAVLLTTGRTVAAEQAVLAELDAAG